MLLTVRTPSKILFEGEVSDVTIPTRIGQITILPKHVPLTTIVESGIIQCTPIDQSLATDQTFVFDKKRISLAIGGGITYIDGDNIIILGTAGSKEAQASVEKLNKKKAELKKKIEEHQETGDLHGIEQAITDMDAIDAEIKLSEINK